MKIQKVLLSLCLGLFVSFSGTSVAQTNPGNKLVEVGPDNIGGRVTSLIVDKSDASSQTLYAGAATGGLYVRDCSDFNNIWNYVPCVIDGEQMVLPISSMVQGSDNTIYIATSEGCYPKGVKSQPFSPAGRGIFRFNPADGSFKVIPTSVPTGTRSFNSINKLAIYDTNGVTYLYAATTYGLFRWEVRSESDWNSIPEVVFGNAPVQDVVVAEGYNMLYFSAGSELYRIGNIVNNSVALNISASNRTIFPESAERIYLAVPPTNPNTLYAMVIGASQMMNGVYMTKNQTTWTTLTTSSLQPFSFNSGVTSGAITVHPNLSNKVYIGGSYVLVGEGFVDGANYQWTKASQSEYEFGSANFMQDIFASPAYVHSGINQIVVATTETGLMYYIATNGGVYASSNELETFMNLNRGLNNVQVRDVAVAIDGSVLMGAQDNANIFIESRMGHDGGTREATWYDPVTNINTNHMGSRIWKANGGQVAVSMFQQYAPNTRRTLFTSAEAGQYGRAYSDYNDYSNTQTWTADSNFIGAECNGGVVVSPLVLWENRNNTEINDSITFSLDTLGLFYFEGTRDKVIKVYDPSTNTFKDVTITLQGYDTLSVGATVKAGDSIWVPSPAHADYPFAYRFKEDYVVKESNTFKTLNPLQNRMFAVKTNTTNGVSQTSRQSLVVTWMPSDFRKVCGTSNPVSWAELYTFDCLRFPSKNITAVAVSNDGDCAIFAMNDSEQRTSQLIRIRGMVRNVDYSRNVTEIATQLKYGMGKFDNSESTVTCDTMTFEGSKVIDRTIASLIFDPHAGIDRMIVTFDDAQSEFQGNIYVADNATSDSYTFTSKSLPLNIPVYTAMVEYTTGDVYVGTDDGIFVAESGSFEGSFAGTPTWNAYGNFRGVPVTSIIQQTKDIPQMTYIGHNGISEERYVFPRTKYPYAIYIGTYGRGVFMDSTYVTRHENEVVDSEYYIGIPIVKSIGNNSMKLYPNPAVERVNVELNIQEPGNASLYVYDLTGKMVRSENLGKLGEGEYTRTLSLQGLPQGMYLVNVLVGKRAVASKLIVR